MLNSSLRGAAAGGAYAAFTGNDLGNGLLRGAAIGAAGAAFNMAIGHAWGYLNSGDAPAWRNGAWVYESKGTWPITIGNVVVGDRDELYQQFATSGSKPSLNSQGQPAYIVEHEYGHIPESETLGVAYGPAVLTSYLLGGAWGVLYNRSFGAFLSGTHEYSLFENESGLIAVPDY